MPAVVFHRHSQPELKGHFTKFLSGSPVVGSQHSVQAPSPGALSGFVYVPPFGVDVSVPFHIYIY